MTDGRRERRRVRPSRSLSAFGSAETRFRSSLTPKVPFDIGGNGEAGTEDDVILTAEGDFLKSCDLQCGGDGGDMEPDREQRADRTGSFVNSQEYSIK